MGAHLTALVEAQVVMGVWWVVWFGVLTYLLYTGTLVDDELVDVSFSPGSVEDILETVPNPGCAPDPSDGCLAVIGILVGVVLLYLAFVLLIELVLPGIALILLVSVGGMLARVANDTHDCERKLGRSLTWAFVWSTTYVLPIALAVIGVVSLLANR
jgi:hypothetical protein